MSDEKLTLSDIAALIVQIEPTDLADWARLTLVFSGKAPIVQ